MSDAISERCEVCGRTNFPGITDCPHSPEEWAAATVDQIMAKHLPTLRAAFALAAGEGQ